MTKIEIIKEVLEERYCKDPSLRAIKYNQDGIPVDCLYEVKKDDGTVLNCAVGACLTKKGIDYAMKNNIGSVFDFLNSDNGFDAFTLDKYLKVKYKGHDTQFWSDLQGFHDHDVNFTETGLTERGKNRLNKLKEGYA
jgi:hypothetical protein